MKVRLLVALLLSLSFPVRAFDGFPAWGFVNEYYPSVKGGTVVQVAITWYNPDAPLTSRVAIYRDGVLQPSTFKNHPTINNGVYIQYVPDDSVFTYVVCMVESGECSIPVTVVVD